jgi:predicted metalloprotease
MAMARTQLLTLVLAAALMAVLAAGCAAAGSSSRAGENAAARPAATATPICANGSLEGCFGYSGMQTYLRTVEPMVAQFFEEQYPRLRGPRDVVFIPTGTAVRDGCGSTSDSGAYEYCPANQTIFIGQDLLWSFYRRYGDAAPVVGLAHEWGHHVQVMLGVPNPRSLAARVRFENQADCLSGAFIKYAGEQKWLEPDDLGDIDGVLQAIGAREGPGRDHGTAAERKAAFNQGYESGAKACNSYSPTTPVG